MTRQKKKRELRGAWVKCPTCRSLYYLRPWVIKTCSKFRCKVCHQDYLYPLSIKARTSVREKSTGPRICVKCGKVSFFRNEDGDIQCLNCDKIQYEGV